MTIPSLLFTTPPPKGVPPKSSAFEKAQLFHVNGKKNILRLAG